MDLKCVLPDDPGGPGARVFGSAEAMAKGLAAMVASRDPNRLRALLITEEETRRLATGCGEDLARALEQRTNRVVASFERRWERLERGRKRVSDPSSLRLESFKAPKMRSCSAEGRPGAPQVMDGDFAFTVVDAAGTVFRMEAEEIVVLDGVWILADAEVEFEF